MPAASNAVPVMDNHSAKPGIRIRVRRAGVCLIPFAVLAIAREVLDIPDEMLAMPANGIPLTRVDALFNLATGFSLWFGVLGFLARLVWDDSPGLTAILMGLMIFAAPWAGAMMLYIVFS
jgi:hypothetical protein